MFQNFKSRLNAAVSENQEHSDAEWDQLVADLQTCQGQLARYKQRLSDVVQAYKALQKEKQALEASLQALNTASEPTVTGNVRIEMLSPTAEIRFFFNFKFRLSFT